MNKKHDIRRFKVFDLIIKETKFCSKFSLKQKATQVCQCLIQYTIAFSSKCYLEVAYLQIKVFVFCSKASYFQESRSLIPVEDKSKVHYVLAITRCIENFVQWVTASGPLVMQPTNLSVVPSVMRDWCKFFACYKILNQKETQTCFIFY